MSQVKKTCWILSIVRANTLKNLDYLGTKSAVLKENTIMIFRHFLPALVNLVNLVDCCLAKCISALQVACDLQVFILVWLESWQMCVIPHHLCCSLLPD